MKVFALPFLLIAGAGFLLSLMAHVLALLGIAMPCGEWIFALHVGVFVVWIPAIFMSKSEVGNLPRKDQMEAILAACPMWMRLGVNVLFVYSLVNFVLFLISMAGQPKHAGVTPALVRGFSGHWMIFYAVAFVTFYSILNRSAKKLQR